MQNKAQHCASCTKTSHCCDDPTQDSTTSHTHHTHERPHSVAPDRAVKSLAFMTVADGGWIPRKRLFIGLVSGTSILICLCLLIGWVVPVLGLGSIHPLLPYITGGLIAVVITCIAWAVLGLIIQILRGKPLLGSDRVRGLTIKLFLPLMELLGKLLGFSANEVRQSFIKVNNELALASVPRLDPTRVLILLPHCVQRVDCQIRLSYCVDACKRCGKCPIEALLALRDKYGVHLAVATGGSIARRIVVETRPKFVIAVACERDLTSGIQDAYPVPVFGILNSRPDGPCRNTQVTISLVEGVLQHCLVPLSGAVGSTCTVE